MTDNYTARKDRDQELYDIWKTTGNKRDLGNLLTQLSPVIYSEVRRASGSLPTAALSAEAKRWAIRAVQTYAPEHGAALSTHVANYVQKVRRSNYQYQNAVRLPENMQLKYHEYNRTLTDLTDELNREPTDEELARALGWTKPQTVKFKNSLYADLVESASARPSEFTQFNENAILMEHLMNQLTSDEKFILENNKILSSTDMAEKLGVNINRLNYLKSKLTSKIKDIQRDIGL
jgi:DNA-directed RNA polymerase specialized sigma subunit